MFEGLLRESRKIILPLAFVSVLAPKYEILAEEKEKSVFEDRQWNVGLNLFYSAPMRPERFKENFKKAETYGFEVQKIWNKVGFGFIYGRQKHKLEKGNGEVVFNNVSLNASIYPITNDRTIPFFAVSGGYTKGEYREGKDKEKDDGSNISIRAGLEYAIENDVSLRFQGGYTHHFMGDGFGSLHLGAGIYVNLF